MKYSIETITPVHIGNGEKISPYSDYILEDGYVYYIDHNKLERYLFELEGAEKIIDEFVEIIKRQAGSNKSNKYNLKNFFQKNNLDFKDFVHKKVPATDKITEEIHKTVYSGINPYIPGSSIKGSIRTTLLYFHLKGKNLNLNIMNRGYIGQDVFGKYGEDILKHLHVSDTIPFDPEKMVVAKTYRFNLKKQTTTIPVVKEAIREGVKSKLNIQTKAKKDYHVLKEKFSYLYQGNEKEILKIINKFTIELLEREIDLLQHYCSETMKKIINININILNEAKQLLENGNGAILRVGSGKSYFDNTIAGLFNDKQLTEATRVRSRPFPKTRTVVTNFGEIETVLGWVRIKEIMKN